jgi:hypothetical protein
MRVASTLTLVAFAVVSVHSVGASLSFAEQTRLLSGAQQVLDAARRGDVQTVAAHTSRRITRLGVPADSIQTSMQAAMAQTAASGVSLDSAELGSPSVLYQAVAAEVCFIPYRQELHIAARKGRSFGFFVAVREDSTGEWAFLDGSRLRAHPEALGRLLPGLPSGIELPETRDELDN